MAIVACIGQRGITRHSERCYLEAIGAHLAESGHTISTGNAPGADQLFALGAGFHHPHQVELYLPWPRFEEKAILQGNRVFHAADALPEHRRLAEQAHPAWTQLSGTVRNLMIRNAMIVRRFDRPADFVYAWPNLTSPHWGGTGHGINVARGLGIPVFIINQQRWL
jgi:predicted Rossmann-fold nucleotide-binding protein